jgi:hypothetical protein
LPILCNDGYIGFSFFLTPSDPDKKSAGSVIQEAFHKANLWKLFLDELGHEPYQKAMKVSTGGGKNKSGGQASMTPLRRKVLSKLELDNLGNRVLLIGQLANRLLVAKGGSDKGVGAVHGAPDFLKVFETRVLEVSSSCWNDLSACLRELSFYMSS